MAERLIPTLAMAQDPRLRRLFALVGIALDQEDLMEVEDALTGVMLDLAPEFLPPDDLDVSGYEQMQALRHEWWALVEDARRHE